MTTGHVPSVRDAVPDDAAAIHRLLTQLGRPPAAPPSPTQDAVLRAHMAAPDCHMLLAELDDAIVGFACVWIRLRLGWETPEAWIPDLVVDEHARRRGVAGALIGACRARALAAGCHQLRLESGHHRTAAHELYRTGGFVAAGVAYQFPLTSPATG